MRSREKRYVECGIFAVYKCKFWQYSHSCLPKMKEDIIAATKTKNKTAPWNNNKWWHPSKNYASKWETS